MSNPNHITVFLDEECGYREWLWHTGMTAEELEAWWSNLKSVSAYFMSPKGLPGELFQVVEDLTHLDAEVEKAKADPTLSDDEIADRVVELYKKMPINMVIVIDPDGDDDADDVDENGEKSPPPKKSFRPIPDKQPGWWTGHIHMDDDTYLRTDDGREILHAGFGKGSWVVNPREE